MDLIMLRVIYGVYKAGTGIWNNVSTRVIEIQ